MIYPQRDNKRKLKKRFTVIGIFVALFICLILINSFIPHVFSPLTHALSGPATRSKDVVANSFSGVANQVQSKQSLLEENKSLREKVIFMDAGAAERKALLDENTALKALLQKTAAASTSATTSKHRVLAEITSKPGYSPYDTIVINAGQQQGIAVGDSVVADENIIIGEVQTVYSSSATVILYSTSEYKVDVFIGLNHLETTAVGKGGGNFEIRLPRNADIHEGDVITLARSPEHVFGTVNSIKASDTDSFERVLFRSAVNVGAIRYVMVEKNEK